MSCFSLPPGCSRCDNEPSFQQGDHIPIFPLPPVAMLKKCSSKNHHKCFTKALEKQLFQAHSVEELVVWLVESEKECSLEAYVKDMRLDKEETGSVAEGESEKCVESIDQYFEQVPSVVLQGV